MSEVVVVTGAAGFLGYHIAAQYLKNNFTVIGIDNLLTGTAKNVHDLQANPNFQFIRHSVEDDWYVVEQMMKVRNLNRIKYIFHFASIAEPTKFQSHFPEIMKANSVGTTNALEFARRFKARVIFASSSEIYGNIPVAEVSEKEYGNVNSVGYRSCYNESKRFSESYISHTNRVYGTEHGVVRIFNTYGPRMNPQDTRVVSAIINWALRNQDIEVYGGDQRTRSFCYVDDLVKGIMAYADSKIQEPMNLGNDEETPIVELAKKIIKMSRSKSKIIFKDARLDEVEKRKPCLTFAKKSIQFKTSVSLDDGLFKTVEYLKQNAQTRFHTTSNQTKVDQSQNSEQVGQ